MAQLRAGETHILPQPLRCESCQINGTDCVFRPHDTECKACFELGRSCLFQRTYTIRTPAAGLSWGNLLGQRQPTLSWNSQQSEVLRSDRRWRPEFATGTATHDNTYNFSPSYAAAARSSYPPYHKSTGPVYEYSFVAPPAEIHTQREGLLPSFYARSLDRDESSTATSTSRAAHEGRFKCHVPGCALDNGFRTRNDLDRHKLTVHKIPSSGAKVYVCQAASCLEMGKNKIWPRKDNFKNHCKVAHTDEDLDDLIQRSQRPFDDPAITNIENTETENEATDLVESVSSFKHACNDCQATFSRASDLRRHQETVHNANRELLDCQDPACERKGDKGFSRRDHWREHMQKVHNIELPSAPEDLANTSTARANIRLTDIMEPELPPLPRDLSALRFEPLFPDGYAPEPIFPDLAPTRVSQTIRPLSPPPRKVRRKAAEHGLFRHHLKACDDCRRRKKKCHPDHTAPRRP